MQVAQLERVQDPQPPPVPATAWLPPLPLLWRLLLKAENKEMARAVSPLPQSEQSAGASALLIGRNFSNLMPQSAQLYSYRGIVLPPTHPDLARKLAYCTMLLGFGQTPNGIGASMG